MSDFASLADRLIDACVASCTCLTKTPDVEHHDLGCHYRLFDEAHRALVRLNQCESKLSAADEAWHEQEDELQALRGKLDTARLALRDIMSRSNPQEWVFQRAHEALKDVGFPK